MAIAVRACTPHFPTANTVPIDLSMLTKLTMLRCAAQHAAAAAAAQFMCSCAGVAAIYRGTILCTSHHTSVNGWPPCTGPAGPQWPTALARCRRKPPALASSHPRHNAGDSALEAGAGGGVCRRLHLAGGRPASGQPPSAPSAAAAASEMPAKAYIHCQVTAAPHCVETSGVPPGRRCHSDPAGVHPFSFAKSPAAPCVGSRMWLLITAVHQSTVAVNVSVFQFSQPQLFPPCPSLPRFCPQWRPPPDPAGTSTPAICWVSQ